MCGIAKWLIEFEKIEPIVVVDVEVAVAVEVAGAVHNEADVHTPTLGRTWSAAAAAVVVVVVDVGAAVEVGAMVHQAAGKAAAVAGMAERALRVAKGCVKMVSNT